jgi:hypothetical protein
MNDNQLEILRSFVAEKTAQQSQRLRDADKFASRRSKFIWSPYISRTQKAETEQKSMGINDFLGSQKIDPAILLSSEGNLRKFLLECARLKNQPSQSKS